jgi:hypothetical protein
MPRCLGERRGGQDRARCRGLDGQARDLGDKGAGIAGAFDLGHSDPFLPLAAEPVERVQAALAAGRQRQAEGEGNGDAQHEASGIDGRGIA